MDKSNSTNLLPLVISTLLENKLSAAILALGEVEQRSLILSKLMVILPFLLLIYTKSITDSIKLVNLQICKQIH